MSWEPIEGAPKDGTSILACRIGYQPSICQWVEFAGEAKWSIDPETFMEEDHFSNYFNGSSYEPDVWMPIPWPYTIPASRSVDA